MTTTSVSIKAFLFVFLFLLVILVNFFAQTPQPSPATTPEPSPSASPSVSPTPARAPSPTPLPGAQNYHQWGSVTVFNGLPSDSVRAIAQTPDGVMWFGTDNGLARFDGRRVQNFSPGGAETNGVLALEVAATGELWIGTRAGAFVYADGRFQTVVGTADYGITTILIDDDVIPDDDVFLGTDGGLVLRAVRDQVGVLPAISMIREPIKASDGAVVSITGLIRRDGILLSTAGRGLFEITGNVAESEIKSRSPLVHAIERDADERIWLGTEATKGASGVYVVGSNGQSTRVSAPTSDVFALEANESGLWAGTERYGLFHIASDKLKKNYTFENTSGGLRSNTVFTLFTDREGVIWIGTNRGVSRFDRLGAIQQTVSDIPNSNFIRTLLQAEDGTVYAGSNRGLFALDRVKETWNEVSAFRNKVVYALRKRLGSSIVVGAPDGLFDISGRKIFDGDVRSLAGYNRRDYAAVLGRGVVEITGDRSQVVVPDATVTSIAEGKDKLWIGTLERGLFSWDGSTVKTEAGRDVLNSGTVWSMSQPEPDGPVYIAAQHGVFAFREGDVEQIIAAEDVRDVVERDGHIWAASTTRGLLHAWRDDRFGWLVSSIAFEQGLPSEKAFSIQPAGDSLIVATNRGVVTYEAGKVAPKLIATRVLSQRAHDLAELRSTIPLEYPQNSLLIEVAGQSSRTFPEEFQYAFLLTDAKGVEIDRRLSNESQYAPADLAPGEYTIEAIAFNRDLLPSEPLFMRFSVAKAPFPWTATALGVLLLMALVALAWAIFEHRRIKQRNRELAAARLDLANEAERERRRIARDLHDQTLADLRSLMMTTDKLPAAGATVREEIESISTDIRRICEDLSPSVLENVGLVAALEFLLDRTVQSKSFVADDAVERDTDFPLHVQLQIYRIAQEVLTNIARHSDADSVEMRVDMREEDFVLTVRDNGTTFQPDGTSNGRGISNIRARANLINGRVAWKESRQGGNVFSLRIGAGNGSRGNS